MGIMGITMRRLGVPVISAVFSLLCTLVSPAATVVITAYQSGYVRETGLVENPTGNYFTGQLNDEQYRGYFIFDLSALAGLQVTSAIFRLDTDDFSSPDATETVNFYQYTGSISTLTSAPTISPTAFGDLGNGTLLGSHVYAEPEQDVVLDINLNNDAIAALNSANGSGSIAFGAVMVTLSGSSDQWVYGQSDNLGSTRQLRVETVPEPGTIGLLCAAAGLGLFVRFRRK